MDHSYPYIASLTREPFLFYEMRSTAKIMSEGISDDAIVKKLQSRIFSSIQPSEELILILQRVYRLCVKQQGLSLDAALGLFYHSKVYQLMRDGVSDMHCMSNLYLAEELRLEYIEKILANC